jgi:hypothetical protein
MVAEVASPIFTLEPGTGPPANVMSGASALTATLLAFKLTAHRLKSPASCAEAAWAENALKAAAANCESRIDLGLPF